MSAKFHDPNETHPISHKKYGDLYEATIRRTEELIDFGYKVVFIWEHEFYDQYGKREKTIIYG